MNREDIIRKVREDDLQRAYENGYKAGNVDSTPATLESSVHEWLGYAAALIITAKVAEYQDLLEIQQRSYERQIQIEVENEREACAKVCERYELARSAAAAIRARRST